MTAEELMDQYKMVREEEFGLGLGLIINPDAQVGGILLVGMNPSGKGDDIYSLTSVRALFGIRNMICWEDVVEVMIQNVDI